MSACIFVQTLSGGFCGCDLNQWTGGGRLPSLSMGGPAQSLKAYRRPMLPSFLMVLKLECPHEILSCLQTSVHTASSCTSDLRPWTGTNLDTLCDPHITVTPQIPPNLISVSLLLPQGHSANAGCVPQSQVHKCETSVTWRLTRSPSDPELQ